MINTLITITCDGKNCDKSLEGGNTGTNARRAARDQKWANVGSKDFCPKCDKERTKDFRKPSVKKDESST